MSIWYYETNGAESGPFTSSQLINRIHAGNVTKDTLIRKDDSQWVRAIEISGLFEAAARPIILSYCPYCEHLNPGEVPCECPGCNRQINRVVKRKEPSPVTADGERNPDSPRNQASIKSWVKKLFE